MAAWGVTRVVGPGSAGGLKAGAILLLIVRNS